MGYDVTTTKDHPQMPKSVRILLLSRAYFRDQRLMSDWVATDLASPPPIPVLLEDCNIPPELVQLQYVDFRRIPWEYLDTKGKWQLIELKEAIEIAGSAFPAVWFNRLVELPEELINDVAAGQCVLFAGAGLSATAGVPIWSEIASGLAEIAAQGGAISESDLTSFREAAKFGKADLVLDQLVGQLGLHFVREQLLTIIKDPAPSAGHQALRGLPFSAALTTNLDNLLEKTFNGRLEGRPPLAPSDAEQLFQTAPNREFFLLKLYGHLARPESLLISSAQFHDFASDNPAFRSFVENLFVSRTILFVGSSLEGIETYLRGMRVKDLAGRKHYAIAGVLGTSWETTAKVLERRFGIHVIPYTSNNTEHLTATLRELGKRVTAAKVVGQPAAGAPLSRVVLSNIGPFEQLDLQLQPGINILLGNNGVGKSTILRALATGLCARTAEPWASRIMRVGTSTSDILIETGSRNTYQATLQSNRGRVEMNAGPSPIEAEGWLALGFPPLRTISTERANGPSKEGPATPRVEDMLPLAKGDADLRLDQLQQWLVNIDYRISKGEARYQSLRDRFFEIVSDLTQGVTIRFGSVDAATNRVTVITDDGAVPLEFVSQGTASLLSWIGVVLQRLYEVYPNDDDPTHRYLLVLMDEIDAHMHPSWQRLLIPKLRKIFPNMQLVATTHSPLIVSGLEAESVLLIERRDGKVGVQRFEKIKLAGQEVDQILTGPLFNLSDTRDPGTEAKQRRYVELATKGDGTAAELEERERLARELYGRSSSDLQAIAGPVVELVEQSIEARLAQLPEAERQRQLEDAARLIHEGFAARPQ